ncbi:hypothetical protein C5167_049527 [Papaver somniferum]|uniref:Alpha-N-acetylglucosaminidase tim-barrel domain-containing protein n=1 Tax=Papaver somniferum TaxID=3469 RepID=A0A4Y7KPK8_PAPSO|nr:hypothetical protein C5167_049527 [Papaver somniferum]
MTKPSNQRCFTKNDYMNYQNDPRRSKFCYYDDEASDTFNENLPPTNDPKYISQLGAAVYKAMSKGNKDAVWLMQGWLFSSDSAFWHPAQMRALLHSVPFGKMIVLDLFAEVKPIWKKSSQFYGTPYIW